MINSIKVNDTVLIYELERKKVKNINLRIKPNQSIYVSANENVSIKEIESFIVLKFDYICNALNRYAEIAQYAPKPKQYVDGESFLFMGHELRLKVISGQKNNVTSDGVYITLSVKDVENTEQKSRAISKWMNNQCKDKITEICNYTYPTFLKYNINFPEIRFRKMISRWGSCQPKRNILTFNYALIQTPVLCMEYVVMHEFTHFLQPNHSKMFYYQLGMFMPDWKERKNILEKYII